jgi:hypothetical protein
MNLRKTLGLVLACLIAASAVSAQTTPSVITMQDAATATGNGTSLVVGVSSAAPGANLGAVGVQIVGTFSATITFEATTDGTNWTSIMATELADDSRATTATAAGHYTILYGSAIRIRARISAYTSGTVTVKARLIPGLTARLTSGGGGGGSGTVTSVAFTGGLISVADPTAAAALTVAGTSGGIPYFDSASTWATSAALAANALVIGGGAGVAPSTTTTGTGILTFLGTPSSANLATALTDETGGSGLAVFNSTPTIITPSFTTGFTIGGVAATGTIPRGNGTNFVASAYTMAAPGTSGNVLTSDGTNWLSSAPAAGVSGANPTASVGLSAVNGVATTFLRSDGAPALDVTIAPTWTGIHTFTNGVTTGTTSTSGTVFNYNALTTGTGHYIGSTSSTGSSTTTKLLHVAKSGAQTGAVTTTAGLIENVSTGASATNVALTLTASGATTANTALNVTAGQSIFAVGSVTAPGITWSSGATTGFYSAAPGTTSWTGGSGAPSILFGGGLFRMVSTGQMGFASGSSDSTNLDTIWRRNGAADFGLGASATSATPVAYGISAQGASGTNTNGATWTHTGSLGTSQGVPGVMSFKTGGLIAASGTTAQTAVSRLELGATKVLTNNTVTTVVNVTDASNTVAAGFVEYSVEVFDGTDLQVETGSFTYQVTNKGGTIANNTITFAGASGVGVTSNYPKNTTTSGTLAVTWAISAANPALLSVNANSSLTPSTGYPRVTYNIRNQTQQAIAVQ